MHGSVLGTPSYRQGCANLRGDCGKVWLERLAVAAPRGIEHSEHFGVVSAVVVEGLIIEELDGPSLPHRHPREIGWLPATGNEVVLASSPHSSFALGLGILWLGSTQLRMV